MIFSLCQLTPKSLISSSSNWTSSMFKGEINKSILRSSTSRETPLPWAKHKSQSTSHVHYWHWKSMEHKLLLCKSNCHIFLCSKWCVYQCKYLYCSFGLHVHTDIMAGFKLAYMSESWCMQYITKLITIQFKSLHNNCSNAPVTSGEWWEHSFEGGKVSAWEKGPGKGKADYFKDWMWASGSKHADCTWREIYSRILAARQSRWRWDFITEGYIR